MTHSNSNWPRDPSPSRLHGSPMLAHLGHALLPSFSVSQNWHVALAPMLALGCVMNVSSFLIKANNFELTLHFRLPLMAHNKCMHPASPSDTMWNVHTNELVFAEHYNTTNNTKEQVLSKSSFISGMCSDSTSSLCLCY